MTSETEAKIECENCKGIKLLLGCVLKMFEKYVVSDDRGQLIDDMKLVKAALDKTDEAPTKQENTE